MPSFRKTEFIALAVAVASLLLLLYVGCGSDREAPTTRQEQTSEAGEQISSYSGYSGVPYLGEVRMEELALSSEVIARVRFNAVEQTIEGLRYIRPNASTIDLYAGAVVITFDVLEYLKGSGGSQVRAVLVDGDSREYTEAEVRAKNEDLLGFRDKQWDDRDAIVFLSKAPLVPRTLQVSDLYYMTFLRANGRHAYTVDSKWAKAWLPAAAAPGSGQEARASGDSQRFLTSVSGVSDGGSATGRASRDFGGEQESMTLDEIKTFIANLEAEVTAGGGQ